MIRLYQFPISHYCEKIRWTLDYKKLDYEVENLLPGLHTLKTKKIAKFSSVAVLTDNENVFQNSNEIISYLDETYQNKLLTPLDELQRNKVLEWETFIDKEIGIHIRCCCYHILLEQPNIVLPFLSHNGPWYGKMLLKIMFPKLKVKMRSMMSINESSALLAKEKLHEAVDKLKDHYSKNDFLVGDKFTRADLSAAALMAPLCVPKKYGLDWPKELPVEMNNLVDEFKDKTAWVQNFYNNFR